ERFEGADHCRELHAVVRGVTLAPEELSLGVAVDEQRTPAARTGIALAGTIGVDRDGAGHRSAAVRVGASMASVHSMHSRACRGAVASPRLARSHAGVMMRMPSTRFVARRKYTPPA